MRNAWVIARKEIRAFYFSWMGIFVFTFTLLIAGVFFSLLVLTYAKISMDPTRESYEGLELLGMTRFVLSSFFLNMSLVLIFLVPVVSMRSFAEEKRMRTVELLFTYPVTDFEIVWGKFIALVGIFEILFLPSLIYLGVLGWLGGEVDWGVVLAGYLGFWLLGNAYLSLGLFISSLTESQVGSAVVTFACLILLWMFDWLSGVTDGTLSQGLRFLSPLQHYREFARGIIDLSNVVYFAFFHFYFLFLSLRSVETRNWKG